MLFREVVVFVFILINVMSFYMILSYIIQSNRIIPHLILVQLEKEKVQIVL